MIRLLEFLFSGCWHKWTILNQGALYEDNRDKLPIGRWVTLRCEKCGDVKRKTFR